jgi:hypothetical protein
MKMPALTVAAAKDGLQEHMSVGSKEPGGQRN